MRLLVTSLLALLLAVSPASAQITVPNTFTPSTVISSADVNENFSTIAGAALNRTGGTLTGNITASGGVTIDGIDLSAWLNQDVKSTASPTFVNVTSALTGNTTGTHTGAVVGTTGTFSSTLGVSGATTLAGMSATTGVFSSTLGVTGLITSSGGISGGAASHTTGTFSGAVSMAGLTATTGVFSSTLQSAGFTATTGTFSGAVSMAGLTATTGAFSGAVTGTTYNGQTISSNANFTGSLSVAGSTVLNGSVSGQSFTTTGNVSAVGVLSQTGSFTSVLGVTGLATFNGGVVATTVATPSVFNNSGDFSFGANSASAVIKFYSNSTHQTTMDLNGDFVPVTDATKRIGTDTNRFLLIRGVTITPGDLLFENGWALTESYKVGIDQPGVALLNENGELVTFFGRNATYGKPFEDVGQLSYVVTTPAERAAMDTKPTTRIKGQNADGTPIYKTAADVPALPVAVKR